MAKSFKVLRDSHDAKAGETVYDYIGCDYGCASDDTRYLGVKHVAITRDPNGGIPFITAPERDLQEIDPRITPHPRRAAERTASEVADAIDPRKMRYENTHGGTSTRLPGEQALIAAADMLRAREWRPISEAPKDGKPFLAALSSGWCTILWATEEDFRGRFRWWHGSSPMTYPIVETHNADTDWAATNTILATHWQALPAAPQEPR